jgi:hypothetical protein
VLPLQNIDLLPFQSSLRYQKDKSGLTQVFDPIRKKFLIATPEEIVRQLWIAYFTEYLKVNPKLIAIERAFSINDLNKRFDLVVFSNTTKPVLLAEFKAPGVKITQSTFDQIAQYNMALHVPYTLVSNGMQHFCFQIDDKQKEFVWLKELPQFSLNTGSLPG